jgi:hypothetical protein
LFFKITLDHHNKTFEIFKLGLIGFFDSVVVFTVISEGFLTTDNPRAVVDQKATLSWSFSNPLSFI